MILAQYLLSIKFNPLNLLIYERFLEMLTFQVYPTFVSHFVPITPRAQRKTVPPLRLPPVVEEDYAAALPPSIEL